MKEITIDLNKLAQEMVDKDGDEYKMKIINIFKKNQINVIHLNYDTTNVIEYGLKTLYGIVLQRKKLDFIHIYYYTFQFLYSYAPKDAIIKCNDDFLFHFVTLY